MARYTGPAYKKSRRLGFSTLENGKDLAKRAYAPGQHGQDRRRKLSEYGIQMQEKQKVRILYGLNEKQFHKVFDKASKMHGIAGENLLILLESRLDNMVYRLGMARTRRSARQIVNHGHILVNGKKVDIYSPKSAIQNHIALVPEDRARCGLNLGATIRSNMCTTILNKTSKFHGALSDSKAEYNYTRLMMDKMHIKATGSEQEAGSLSGGNQQKVVVAKWLANNPQILIVDEPTRGIDVAAKKEIHNLISNLAKSGVAIIMISSEMPEVLGMCDRIYVMHEGRIRSELCREEATQEKIMKVILQEDA